MSVAIRPLRWDVKMTGVPTTIGGGKVLLIACRSHGRGAVEVWTEEVTPESWPKDPLRSRREVVVVGTGQPVPTNARYHIGSAVSADGRFVWHVYEIK